MERTLSTIKVPVIFELGMFNGRDTEMILSWVENPLHYGFEPDPRNVKTILATDLPERIHFYAGAIGNLTGTIPLNCSSVAPNGDTGSSSISKFTPELTRRWPWLISIGTIIVRCWRLDDFCERHEIGRIDLLWMDVQGAERLVFDGAKEMLKKTRLVWTEYDDGTLYEDSSTADDITKTLEGWQVVANTGSDMLLENQLCPS